MHTQKRKNALLNTVTFKLLADFLLMSSTIYSAFMQTNNDADSEFPLAFPWSNVTTLTTKHLLSKHTTSPKVGWYDMSEYVDSCDLFLCQTSVFSPKTREWWQDRKKTHSNNQPCHWGGDRGIIINDGHAAGQRCSPKTSLLSPEGQNEASINWQADVLEFLSWALAS